MLLADLPPGQLQLWIIVAYLGALILLGIASSTVFKGTAVDYFVASRGVGPILLVLSVFGTTMTAFAIQGSSGEAWASGIGVYGKMASWSGIIHAACFFLIGVKLWSFGKRYGYQTQIQFFRDRFESSNLGVLLFPILALLQMPYIIIGIIGSGNMIGVATRGAFPGLFPTEGGAVPFWLGTLVATGVVWLYVSLGGARATAWANALQTLIFLVVGVLTFWAIGDRLGGFAQATRMVQEANPSRLTRGVSEEHEQIYAQRLAEWNARQGETPNETPKSQNAKTPKPPDAETPKSQNAETPKPRDAQGGLAVRELQGAVMTSGNDAKAGIVKPHRLKEMTELEFFSYGFIPLSVAMFPHLFQLWLTARSAKTFRLTVTLHPILIMLIWAPCVLIGVWATSAVVAGRPIIPPDHTNPNSVLGMMVTMLRNPYVSGLLAAGVLAAILGGMDAQFLSLGSMFTHDIVDHFIRHDAMTDRQRLLVGRFFVILVVLVSWILSIVFQAAKPIFGLAIWCFSGFAALFPLVCAALYWKRVTKWGAYASILSGIGLGVYYYLKVNLATGFAGRGDPIVNLGWGEHALHVVPAVPMVLAATATLIVVSWVTRPPAPETLQKFFRAD